ncbi:MAG: SAM-dependent methyltransferase [Caldimonas sp.]
MFLVPNALDFGAGVISASLDETLPREVIRIASTLRFWIAENAKTTRAFLKRVDAIVPLAAPLQSIEIVELPRPQKGGSGKGSALDASAFLRPSFEGHSIGLISEAGLPAVADPGAAIVAAAHALEIEVIALPGPSSLLLALAASGHNGQSFAFVGYLPTDAATRASRIKELEGLSRRHAQTQLMIETPYRNAALLGALIEHLQVGTQLSVSCGLTWPGGSTRSDTIARWRARPAVLPNDTPAVFSLLAG